MFTFQSKQFTLVFIAALSISILTGCASSGSLDASGRYSDDRSPLYVVNGTQLTTPEARATYLRLKPQYFADINVLDMDEATRRYGSAGEFRAVEVTLTDSAKAYSDLLEEGESADLTENEKNRISKDDLEVEPKLLGGIQNLYKKVQYPKECQERGVQGRVHLKFIVDVQGNVEDAEVTDGIGWGCDDEALRVIKTADFVPGLQHGKPVKVTYFLSIMFRLSGR